LSAANRWTGAAAPAFVEAAALRDAGVEAYYGYVGGYKLEQKLRDVAFALPIIDRSHSQQFFRSSVRRIHHVIDDYGIDIVHAHLTYDHWLAWFAASRALRRPILARTFHSRRALRSDPLTRLVLLGATSPVFTINSEFRDAPLLRRRRPVFTPPPLDERLFTPDGADVRERYGIPPHLPVITAIGKLVPDRGFEDVLRTFALIQCEIPEARLIIIGQGPHQPALQALSQELAIEPSVIWAGYHEDDLPEHYRAANLMLFTAKGSDEGHRAVLEAMGCGTLVATYPLEGISALTGPLTRRLIASSPSPERLASTAIGLLRHPNGSLRLDCVRATETFRLAPSAARLIGEYRRFLDGRGR
jgi:phosphatidylinositol alpha-1,6-mannosyltransferase